jgi:hypothetical protein
MKNCHLSSYNRGATLAILAIVTFVASTGWAVIIEGNLNVSESPGASPSDGNLTVEGTTTLNGNINLGSESSTTTFKGRMKADSDMVVGGALKIHSVDGTGNGVVTSESDGGIAENLSNEKIPTTQAVRAYADSKRDLNNDTSLYYPTNYKFKRVEAQSGIYYYILTHNDQSETPVSKELKVNETVTYVLYRKNLTTYQSGANFVYTYATVHDNCQSSFMSYEQSKTDYPPQNYKAYFRVWVSVYRIDKDDKDSSSEPKTLYFCADGDPDPQNPDESSLGFAQIFIH